ncbi:hypothetical protein G6F55_014530 [Rhizopus delemar]|nr:hypothetical protein G6F55_014530 [Rhizopus delemar]
MGYTIGADPAPIHALGVERRGHFSVCGQHDRTTVAAHLRNRLVDHALAGLLRGLPLPVPDTAQRASAQVPAPMIGESPTRP